MQLFYNPNIPETAEEVLFEKEESRHIVKVLRMKEGDSLTLTNGRGFFFNAEITQANAKGCIARILSKDYREPLPYGLHLVVAPTKLNDRYEWFLEKATEIGVSEITPIICDHSERKTIKMDRYEKIIQGALKQSLKSYLPVLNKAIPFKEFIRTNGTTGDSNFIAHCADTERRSLKSLLLPKKNTTILIGPEGDFSLLEINMAVKAGYVPITLGNSRLRTETAAIVACHSVAFVNG